MNRQWLSQWFEGSLWHTSWSCGTSVINPLKSLLPPSLQRSQSFLRISLMRERTIPVFSVQCVQGCAVPAWHAGGCSVPGTGRAEQWVGRNGPELLGLQERRICIDPPALTSWLLSWLQYRQTCQAIKHVRTWFCLIIWLPATNKEIFERFSAMPLNIKEVWRPVCAMELGVVD